MHSDVDLVVQVQALDLQIAELEREISALPKHIAQIEKALESHLRRLEADKAALAANLRDRKQKEGDVQSHQAKISKLRDQMLQAKTNEQYRAFQHEIEYLENEIRKCEDRILELMGEAEPLDQNVKKAEAALKEEQKQVDGEKKIARERTAVDQDQHKKFEADRAELLKKLSRSTATSYERIRKKWKGTVAAEVVNGRCSACQIVLRPQFFQDLRKGEEIMFCESCGRFLYWIPPEAMVDVTTERA